MYILGIRFWFIWVISHLLFAGAFLILSYAIFWTAREPSSSITAILSIVTTSTTLATFAFQKHHKIGKTALEGWYRGSKAAKSFVTWIWNCLKVLFERRLIQ